MKTQKIECKSIRVNGKMYGTPFGYYVGENVKNLFDIPPICGSKK